MVKWSYDWNNNDFINCSFGLSLVRLDIRQESERHMDVVAGVCEYLGYGNYAEVKRLTRIWPRRSGRTSFTIWLRRRGKTSNQDLTTMQG